MKRYEPIINRTAFMGMLEATEGHYVLYSDHAAAIAEKDAMIKKREEESIDWAKMAGANQKQINKLAGEIEEKDKRITEIEENNKFLMGYRDNLIESIKELEAALAESQRREHYAKQDVENVGRLLDKMGAPKLQDSGLSYSIVGRLSAMTREIVGESWIAKIDILTAQLAKMKEERDTLKAENLVALSGRYTVH